MSGCDSKEEGKYTHIDELKKFLLEEHQIVLDELGNDVNLLVVPISSCSDCVDLSLKFVEKHINSQNLYVVLLADRNKDLLLAIRNYNIDTTKMIIERTGQQNWYELGLTGPAIFKLENGNVVFYETLHRYSFDDTIKRLGYTTD